MSSAWMRLPKPRAGGDETRGAAEDDFDFTDGLDNMKDSVDDFSASNPMQSPPLSLAPKKPLVGSAADGSDGSGGSDPPGNGGTGSGGSSSRGGRSFSTSSPTIVGRMRARTRTMVRRSGAAPAAAAAAGGGGGVPKPGGTKGGGAGGAATSLRGKRKSLAHAEGYKERIQDGVPVLLVSKVLLAERREKARQGFGGGVRGGAQNGGRVNAAFLAFTGSAKADGSLVPLGNIKLELGVSLADVRLRINREVEETLRQHQGLGRNGDERPLAGAAGAAGGVGGVGVGALRGGKRKWNARACPRHFAFLDGSTILSVLQEPVAFVREWERIEIVQVEAPTFEADLNAPRRTTAAAMVAGAAGSEAGGAKASAVGGGGTSDSGGGSSGGATAAQTAAIAALSKHPFMQTATPDKFEVVLRFSTGTGAGADPEQRLVRVKQRDFARPLESLKPPSCMRRVLSCFACLTRVSKKVLVLALAVGALCIALASISVTSYFAGKAAISLSLQRLDQSRMTILRRATDDMFERLGQVTAVTAAAAQRGELVLPTVQQPGGVCGGVAPRAGVFYGHSLWTTVEAFSNFSAYPTAPLVPIASGELAFVVFIAAASNRTRLSVQRVRAAPLGAPLPTCNATAAAAAAWPVATSALSVGLSARGSVLSVARPAGAGVVAACEMAVDELQRFVDGVLAMLPKSMSTTAAGTEPIAYVVSPDGQRLGASAITGARSVLVSSAAEDCRLATASGQTTFRVDDTNNELVTTAAVLYDGKPQGGLAAHGLCLVMRTSRYALFCSNLADSGCPDSSFGSMGVAFSSALGGMCALLLGFLSHYVYRARRQAQRLAQQGSRGGAHGGLGSKRTSLQSMARGGKGATGEADVKGRRVSLEMERVTQREKHLAAGKQALVVLVLVTFLLVTVVTVVWLQRTNEAVDAFSLALVRSFAFDLRSTVARGFSAPFALSRLNVLQAAALPRAWLEQPSNNNGSALATTMAFPMMRHLATQLQNFRAHHSSSWPIASSWFLSPSGDYLAATYRSDSSGTPGVAVAPTQEVLYAEFDGVDGNRTRWKVRCHDEAAWVAATAEGGDDGSVACFEQLVAPSSSGSGIGVNPNRDRELARVALAWVGEDARAAATLRDDCDYDINGCRKGGVLRWGTVRSRERGSSVAIDAIAKITDATASALGMFGVQVLVGPGVQPATGSRALDFGPKGFAFATQLQSEQLQKQDVAGIGRGEVTFLNASSDAAPNGNVSGTATPWYLTVGGCTGGVVRASVLASPASPIGAVASELLRWPQSTGVQAGVGFGENVTWVSTSEFELGASVLPSYVTVQRAGMDAVISTPAPDSGGSSARSAAVAGVKWTLVAGMSQQFLLRTVQEWSAINFLVACAIVISAIYAASEIGGRLLSQAISVKTGKGRGSGRRRGAGGANAKRQHSAANQTATKELQLIATDTSGEFVDSLYRRLRRHVVRVGSKFDKHQLLHRREVAVLERAQTSSNFGSARQRSSSLSDATRAALQAAARTGSSWNPVRSFYARIREDLFNVSLTTRALRYIESSFAGMDAMVLLGLEMKGSAVGMWLYYLVCSRSYIFVVNIFLAAHLALAFAEGGGAAVHAEGIGGGDDTVLAGKLRLCDGICIVAFAIDFGIAYFLHRAALRLDKNADGSRRGRGSMGLPEGEASAEKSGWSSMIFALGSGRGRGNVSSSSGSSKRLRPADLVGSLKRLVGGARRRGDSVVEQLESKHRRVQSTQLCYRLVLLMAFSLDLAARSYLARSGNHKSTNATATGGSNLGSYGAGHNSALRMLPYTALLRPLFVLARNRTLWRALRNVFVTLLQASTVLKLALQYMVFAAVAAGVFFKPESGVNGASLPGRGFADFRNSWLTMWVFVTSGENMQDVLNAGTSGGEGGSGFFSKLLFILVSFVGMYVIVALMIASFQEVHATRDAAEQLRMLKQRRQGIVAAFVTLDSDDRGILTFDRYYEVIALLSGARSLGALQEADRGGLRLQQFVDVMEKVLFAPLNGSLEPTARFVRVFGEGGAFAQRRTKRFDFNTIVNQGAFERFFSLYGQEQLLPWLDRFAVVLVFLQVVTLSLVGTFVGDEVLSFQRTVPVFIMLNVGELALRINIMSWAGYWHDGSKPYSRARARFDVVVVMISVVLWIVSVLPISAIGGGLSTTRMSWPALAAVVLPIARMFSVVESTRGLVFGLAHVLPTCLSLFIVLLVVCYSYALVGLLLFQGRLDKLPDSIYSMRDTNFNTMPNAMLTVLQVRFQRCSASLAALKALTAPFASLLPHLYLSLILLLFWHSSPTARAGTRSCSPLWTLSIACGRCSISSLFRCA